MSDTSSAFLVPGDLQLPPELAGEPPRELTESVRNGPLAQKDRRAFWGCLAAAGVCLLLSKTPFVETLALYVLPLGYLKWIALGLAVISMASSMRLGYYKKATRYVQQGQAAFGRVAEIVKYPSVIVNGQQTAYAFQATVEILHPSSGQPVLIQVKSRDFTSSQKDRVDTRFRVGAIVPVVWLPNQFEKTAQIYDFLELKDEASLDRSAQAAASPLWKTILIVISGVLLFFALFWNVYALGRYEPLDFDFFRSGGVPFLVGGGVGLIVAGCSWFSHSKQQKQAELRNAEARLAGKAIELAERRGLVRRMLYGSVIVAGSVLLCGVTFICWAFTANALLDRSPPKDENVQISEMIQTTYSFIFRDYKFKYRRLGKHKDDELLTTPEHLSEFDVPLGVAKVRSGYFGWPWVDTIEPVAGAAGRNQ
jgi:hypothetical protein